MSQPLPPSHSQETPSPPWDLDADRPFIDIKYNDPKTGELRIAGKWQSAGPPLVDIILTNLHEDTDNPVSRIVRAQCDIPMGKLLVHIMNVIDRKGLGVDSVMAMQNAIRVVLDYESNSEVRMERIFNEMVCGVWKRGGKAFSFC
jgi:hypothetical protein